MAEETDMKKLLIFTGMALGGWVGSALTARYGLMTSFLVGTLGSLVGVIAAWRFGRDLA
jgi:predicted MFS family arabinose efflux permease